MDEETLADLDALADNSDADADEGDNYNQMLDRIRNSTQEDIDLVVSANSLLSSLDHSIQQLHKQTADVYAKRFPELDSLIQHPIDYAKVVLVLGNSLDQDNDKLKLILPNASIMVILVTLSTTSGSPLSPEQWESVEQTCTQILSIDKDRNEIYAFVEQRMALFCPNLNHLVGSVISARLLGLAGSLSNLSAIPACNVLVMGRKKNTNVGLSRVMDSLHEGVVYSSDLVSGLDKENRRKVARILSSKVALCARVDVSRGSPDGSIGLQLRDEVARRRELLVEGVAKKREKALPAPIEKVGKKRGGRRARRQKEKMGKIVDSDDEPEQISLKQLLH